MSRTLYVTLNSRPERTRWALQERAIKSISASKARECSHVAAVAYRDYEGGDGEPEAFATYVLQTAYKSREDGYARLVLAEEISPGTADWPKDDEIPELRRGEGIG